MDENKEIEYDLTNLLEHINSHQMYIRELGAANYLQTPVKTLRNWRFIGDRGPRWRKVYGSVYYKISDLDEFMDQFVVDPADNQ